MAARTGNSSYTGMHYTREVSVYPIGVFKKRDLSLTAAEPILLPTPASQAMAIGRRRIKEDQIFAGEKTDGLSRYICVLVQLYPWFELYFPLFWGMVMYDNEFETKENKI